jgi:hypothetical protein
MSDKYELHPNNGILRLDWENEQKHGVSIAHACDELNRLTTTNAQLKARNEELEKIIKEAPHSKNCLYRWSVEGGYGDKSECNCFKARA